MLEEMSRRPRLGEETILQRQERSFMMNIGWMGGQMSIWAILAVLVVVVVVINKLFRHK